jgi:hypothetical protein
MLEEQPVVDEMMSQIRLRALRGVVDMVRGVSNAILPSSSRSRYIGAIAIGLTFGLILSFFIINIERFSEARIGLVTGIGQIKASKAFVDFDVFYIVAQLIWFNELEQAYSFSTMGVVQEAIAGKKIFMPWTYPPQFDLLLAPLAFLPVGIAYSLFTGGTMIVYLATLRAIAGKSFIPTLLLLLPVITITMACGQNGFLTGTLIGLTCLGVQRGWSLAGVPLGLMVIKPHLAVAFALYTLVARHWSIAFVAAVTVTTTSALATTLLGLGVWVAFLAGVKEAAGFLENGLYPLFRMVSPYAVLRTFGFSAAIALAAQILVAVLSLTIVFLARHRGFSVRQSLGLTAIASLLISPYAYDYDLPIYGIGVALLLPDLIRIGTRLEQFGFYSLSLLAGLTGLAQTQMEISFTNNPANGESLPVSLAGLALVALLGLAWRIVARDNVGGTTVVDHRNKPLSSGVASLSIPTRG